VGCR